MTTPASVWSILLVGGDEDDYVLLRSILNQIQGATNTVYWYQEKAPPFHLLTSGLYDVIIIEHEQRPHRGLHLFDEVNKEDAPVKWIMLTDWDLPGLEETALEKGVDAFLSKDLLNEEQLAKTLAEVLRKPPNARR